MHNESYYICHFVMDYKEASLMVSYVQKLLLFHYCLEIIN